jgi:hypothetical protein
MEAAVNVWKLLPMLLILMISNSTVPLMRFLFLPGCLAVDFFEKVFLIPLIHHISHPSLHFKFIYRRIFKSFLPRIEHSKKTCKKHETACRIYSPPSKANYLLPKLVEGTNCGGRIHGNDALGAR